jgi:thiamine biosynthesis lipoprotein
VGIRHPRAPDSAIAYVDVARGGIASSGDYERCMFVAGQRYCHVLNPKTGWPVSGLSAVSVFADQCLVAGTATTIAMLMEAEGEAWLADLGLPHLVVRADGTLGGDLTQYRRPDDARDVLARDAQTPISSGPLKTGSHR